MSDNFDMTCLLKNNQEKNNQTKSFTFFSMLFINYCSPICFCCLAFKILYFQNPLVRGRHSQRFTNTDMVFFCIFPILFLIFNLIYWWSVFSWRLDTWTVHNTPDRYSSDINYSNSIVDRDMTDITTFS